MTKKEVFKKYGKIIENWINENVKPEYRDKIKYWRFEKWGIHKDEIVFKILDGSTQKDILFKKPPAWNEDCQRFVIYV